MTFTYRDLHVLQVDFGNDRGWQDASESVDNSAVARDLEMAQRDCPEYRYRVVQRREPRRWAHIEPVITQARPPGHLTSGPVHDQIFEWCASELLIHPEVAMKIAEWGRAETRPLTGLAEWWRDGVPMPTSVPDPELGRAFAEFAANGTLNDADDLLIVIDRSMYLARSTYHRILGAVHKPTLRALKAYVEAVRTRDDARSQPILKTRAQSG